MLFLPGTTPTLKSRLSIVSSFGKASRPFYVSWCEIPLEGGKKFCGEIGAGVCRREERGKRKSTHRGFGDQARLGSRRRRRRAIRQHQQRKLTGRGFNKNRRAIVFHQPELHKRGKRYFFGRKFASNFAEASNPVPVWLLVRWTPLWTLGQSPVLLSFRFVSIGGWEGSSWRRRRLPLPAGGRTGQHRPI